MDGEGAWDALSGRAERRVPRDPGVAPGPGGLNSACLSGVAPLVPGGA